MDGKQSTRKGIEAFRLLKRGADVSSAQASTLQAKAHARSFLDVLIVLALAVPLMAQSPYAPPLQSLYRKPGMPSVQSGRDVAVDAIPCDPVNGACSGSLAVFRVEADLPAGIAQALAQKGRELRISIESEIVDGVDAPQTPPEYPPAHLRRFTRDGSPDPRAVSIILTPAVPGLDSASRRRRQRPGWCAPARASSSPRDVHRLEFAGPKIRDAERTGQLPRLVFPITENQGRRGRRPRSTPADCRSLPIARRLPTEVF